jgi:hypothetical protein
MTYEEISQIPWNIRSMLNLTTELCPEALITIHPTGDFAEKANTMSNGREYKFMQGDKL